MTTRLPSSKPPDGRPSISSGGTTTGSSASGNSEIAPAPESLSGGRRNTLKGGLGSILAKLRRRDSKLQPVDGLPETSADQSSTTAGVNAGHKETAATDKDGKRKGRRNLKLAEPTTPTKRKAHHILSDSGSEPITHPVLLGQAVRKPAFTPSIPAEERGRATTPRGSVNATPLSSTPSPAASQLDPVAGPAASSHATAPLSAAATVARAKTIARERESIGRGSVEGSSVSRSPTPGETEGVIPVVFPSSSSAEPELKKRGWLSRTDLYRTTDGVDTVKLLRATRNLLLDKARLLGANALTDEKWTCTICGPKHRSDGTFKVTVNYTATAARTKLVDPGHAVALHRARGVPGLMTILDRKAA